jgi:oxaloacetate decarboxylase beta subunit
MLESVIKFLQSMGAYLLFHSEDGTAFWQYLVMYAIVGVLVYLAIVKKFEPLLLLPIAIGMLLTNLPGAGMFHSDLFLDPTVDFNFLSIVQPSEGAEAGLIDILYLGVKLGIYPSLIFIGIGAMTDFTPLISNPKSLLMGAGAQLGVFVAFSGAYISGQFTLQEAASIGIIGGADGPTAILVTTRLAPTLLGAIAIAAYSYMALIPMIQPPFMKLFTTKKEREIKMTALRPVTQLEKVLFPILVTAVVCMIVPSAGQLIGCLMFGNLLNVCGVTSRLSGVVQNGLMNAITIFLGISVGATATAKNFLSLQTILIIVLGLVAFCISTCGGLLTAKIMCIVTKGKINPLIGSAGVSAVPMAARVAQKEGQKADPSNFLLMHAMGPNVAGVIGSAVAAGVLLALFQH